MKQHWQNRRILRWVNGPDTQGENPHGLTCGDTTLSERARHTGRKPTRPHMRGYYAEWTGQTHREKTHTASHVGILRSPVHRIREQNSGCPGLGVEEVGRCLVEATDCKDGGWVGLEPRCTPRWLKLQACNERQKCAERGLQALSSHIQKVVTR